MAESQTLEFYSNLVVCLSLHGKTAELVDEFKLFVNHLIISFKKADNKYFRSNKHGNTSQQLLQFVRIFSSFFKTYLVFNYKETYLNNGGIYNPKLYNTCIKCNLIKHRKKKKPEVS